MFNNIIKQKKRNKFAKSKKKGWKTVDINEIEDYLDQERLNARVGIKGKEFFKIDKKPQILDSPEKAIKRCRGKTFIDLQTSDKPTNEEKLIQKYINSQKRRPICLLKKEKPIKNFYDLWETEGTKSKIHKFSAIKGSLLPAIELPHPGTSYNPSIEDHQDLLKKAVKVEMDKKKKQIKEKKNVVLVSLEEIEKIEKDKFQELDELIKRQQQLKNGEFESNENEFEKSEEKIGIIKKIIKAEDRKTKAFRLKQKRIKESEKNKKEEKQKKSIYSQVYRIKTIEKEIKEREKMLEERKKKRREKAIKKMYMPRKLGKTRYENPDIEVNLKDEITGRLRSINTDGSILEDRFKSFQRRNIIEPRKRILKQRKKAMKYYKKRDRSKPPVKK